jgi:hypothetical protein
MPGMPDMDGGGGVAVPSIIWRSWAPEMLLLPVLEEGGTRGVVWGW